MAPTHSRRSTAMGCRRAMVRMHFSSTSRCSESMLGSRLITRSPSSTSRCTNARTESAIWRSTRPPISATLRVISCRSVSKALAVWSTLVVVMSVMVLPEAPSDVVLRALIPRAGEHCTGRIEVDQFAQIHEGRKFRNPRRLLHVVGDDHDCVIVGQLIDELFDLRGRNRVQ